MDINKIQNLLKENHIDGWLFTDLHGRDSITMDFLQLHNKPHSTRRLFYFIPQTGQAIKLLSTIEPVLLNHLPGELILYQGYENQQEKLKQIFGSINTICTQYSPNGNVPLCSTIDAGFMEQLRTYDLNIVSSANLLQHLEATLTPEQIESHKEAGIKIHNILKSTFTWIREQLNQSAHIDELRLLEQLQYGIHNENLQTDGAPPFFGIDEHAADPGYEPTAATSKSLQEGSRLLIDVSGRLPQEEAIYYDISWCIQIGKKADPQYEKYFQIVKQARDQALSLITERLTLNRPIHGYEIDEQTYDIFVSHNMETYRKHRTGHNIGHYVHGNGANLDAYETHDDRLLIPDTLFSIEPGLYTSQYGVRTEIDAHITSSKELKVYGPIQQNILLI